MEKSENQSYGNNKLNKAEIIRGHDSYLRVLQNSKLIFSAYLKAFVNKQSEDKISIDFTYSPLFTSNVKVGFIIAKKKIKRAYFRNRIRRLLKESYRLNKNIFKDAGMNINILISLTDSGYEYFRDNPETKLEFVETEMKILLKEIKTKYTVQ